MISTTIIPDQGNDQRLLSQLRRTGGGTISELGKELGVTATAVRQRLNRLMSNGLIRRETQPQKRGRPSHRYLLTEKGERHAGTNYADLAIVLWQEIRSIEDQRVRSGLLGRIAGRMAQVPGFVAEKTLEERMNHLKEYMAERQVPLEVDKSGTDATLTILACPYPQLAEHDRGVCAMERMMISELLGEKMSLTSCRLDGANCCTFEPAS